ncbi:S-type pyocin domain-containing protein [Enterovibrio norvegicus]|uniref:S-type pyocin domain-containing protein n=1 Tax=Enterovibrio norvegicus TaxID=188144 RepID=UPI0024B150E7|nr:S-type pyocin domain-containing protein [Enterovibrio norvegicus]
MAKIVRLDSLSNGEAVRIEGNISRYSEADLLAMLPSGSSGVSITSSLARAEMVVVSDNPVSPLFKYSDGKLVANTSNQITVTDQAFNDAKQRFLATKPRMGTSRPANNGPSSSFSESNYVPEPVVTEPPLTPTPPPAISENFAKAPQADKVFAKSCTRPYGDTQACEEEIKAPNFGVMAAMAPARAMTANGLLPLGKVAGTTSKMPLNWALAGDIAKTAASRANFLLLAFWPSQLGDGTMYTDEELAQLPEAVTRVRFRLFQDENGNPQAVGIHTGEGGSYGDRVRRISADAVGESFEAVVDEDLTLTWFPDDSENIFSAGSEYPDTSGLEISNILVRPIDYDGQELDKLVYPNPEAEHIDLIVTFPADSGIAPLYLVFSSPRDKPGVVTGKGEDITGIWLESAGKELGSPVPSQLADKLRGREFSSFDRFREAFWIEVSKDSELMGQFNNSNKRKIKAGRAPISPQSEHYGEQIRYEIHHIEEIQHGGEVYDTDNMRVVTPKNHKHIHYGKN